MLKFWLKKCALYVGIYGSFREKHLYIWSGQGVLHSVWFTQRPLAKNKEWCLFNGCCPRKGQKQENQNKMTGKKPLDSFRLCHSVLLSWFSTFLSSQKYHSPINRMLRKSSCPHITQLQCDADARGRCWRSLTLGRLFCSIFVSPQTQRVSPDDKAFHVLIAPGTSNYVTMTWAQRTLSSCKRTKNTFGVCRDIPDS